MNQDNLNALIGGLIIGLATVVMMHFNGRVAGISGIIGGIFKYIPHDWAWRVLFVLGLLSGGILMNQLHPEGFENTLESSNFRIVIAGLLVGFGTLMGSGCTSGHGVCGISRFSIRSIIATLTFITSGILTLIVMRI